jgi:hypothetical protein
VTHRHKADADLSLVLVLTGTFCIEPSQFIDDIALFPASCAEVVEHVALVQLPCDNSAQGS